MSKEVVYKGKTLEELQSMVAVDFSKITTSRIRRSIKRGFGDSRKSLLNKIDKFKKGSTKKIIRTHCRNQVILPHMLGLTLQVYNGKAFSPVLIQPEMLGKYLGEFVLTRNKVQHSAPGLGATKSSGVKAKK